MPYTNKSARSIDQWRCIILKEIGYHTIEVDIVVKVRQMIHLHRVGVGMVPYPANCTHFAYTPLHSY